MTILRHMNRHYWASWYCNYCQPKVSKREQELRDFREDFEKELADPDLRWYRSNSNK